MKVALVFSGQPRNIESGFGHINKNILECNRNLGHAIDVYGHVWFSQEDVGNSYTSSGGVSASDPISEDTPTIISKLYDPVRIIYEKLNKFEYCNDGRYNNKHPGIIPGNSMSQRYSTLLAFEQITDVVENYDALIRIRFDWGIKTPFLFDDHPLDRITFPHDRPHGGFNDQFAYGPPDLMFGYSELYRHMDRLYQLGIPFTDELLLHEYWKDRPYECAHIPYELLRR